ncbi:MAG: hypothetical protein OJF59_002930 [Cytophagales bacterium]|jgi:hypothetical protein|nr:hypothetical protein [Bacteroidota bacterium]MBS1979625.1 hypothetical protein [Bacteroidota bacterium]WHZ09174.1 MAG: hypothetical protein OJF59_002930 [Cytophagales bacterium]
MRFIVHLLLLLLVVFTTCCAANQSRKTDIQALAEKRLGKGVTIINNSSKTFALAYLSKDRTVSYLVVKLDDNKIVEEGQTNGSVEWSADLEIKVTSKPGMVKLHPSPEDTIRKISLAKYINQM